MVRPLADLPFSVPAGAEVFFNPPSLHGIHRATLASVEAGERDCVVSLEGVTDTASVSDLVGKTVLAHVEDLPRVPEDTVVGRAVTCVERGDLGTIDDVFSAGTANLVWVVHGPFGEVLVPVVDEVVLDIPDDVSQPIVVHLPYGLVDAEATFADEEPDGGEAARSR